MIHIVSWFSTDTRLFRAMDMEFKQWLKYACVFACLVVLIMCYWGRGHLEFEHYIQCQFGEDQGCRNPTVEETHTKSVKQIDEKLNNGIVQSDMRQERISSVTTTEGNNSDTHEIILRTRDTTVAYSQEISIGKNWESRPFNFKHWTKRNVHGNKILVPTGVCNFSSFREQLRLDDGAPFIPVHLLAGCRHVFNNRVPKSGSRSTLRVMNIMAQQHDFSHITLRGSKNLAHWSRSKIEEFLMALIQIYNFNFVFTKHMFYTDFTSHLGYSPIYINVLRDPASWFVSWHSFHKYERHGTKTGQPNIRNVTFDTDVENCIRSDECWIRQESNALHFLCGGAAVCSNYTTEALREARKHLYDSYLVVGQTERLSEYFEVLEFLLPQMFSGSQAVYEANEEEFRNRTKTINKDPVKPDTYQLLKSKMKLDYELYNDAVRRFDKLLAAVRFLKKRYTT